MAGPQAPTPFSARVNGQPVKGLCVQLQTHRPAHLVTADKGSHELETTLRYF